MDSAALDVNMFDNLFAEKYRPHKLEDIILTDENRKIIEQFRTQSEITHLLLVGPPGIGKAQPLSAKIKIPGGWKLMRDIMVNDVVSTPDGKTAKVLGVFPQGKKEIYEIKFKDDRKAYCCKEHLWSVLSYHNTSLYHWATISTEQIITELRSTWQKLSIPLIVHANITDQPLLIDPYTLGYWLGDGTSLLPAFSIGKQDIGDFLNNSEYRKFYIRKDDSSNFNVTIRTSSEETTTNTVLNNLKTLNVIDNKHIPDCYKQASLQQKLDLLQGLVDSDGYVSKTGAISISNTNFKLIKDIQDIVWSIGGITHIREYTPTCMYKGELKQGQLAYTISIRYRNPKDLVRLERKRERCSNNYQYSDLKLKIESVKSTGNIEECQCILIDTPEHLYITDDYIVTHNTSLAKIIVNDILQCQYLYINASDENGIDTIRNKVINFALTKSIDGKLKTIILDEADGLTTDAQRTLRNVMEEYAGFNRFILTGNYKYKIIDPLRSRCSIALDLTPPLEQVMKRCLFVLRTEKINLPSDQQTKFAQLVRRNYPDIRQCLNDIWRYSVGGKTINIPDNHQDSFLTSLYNLIQQKQTTEVRKFIISGEQQIHSDYVMLLRDLFNFIDKNEQDTNKKKMYLLIIAEHLYRSAFVVDQEINTYACCIALINS